MRFIDLPKPLEQARRIRPGLDDSEDLEDSS